MNHYKFLKIDPRIPEKRPLKGSNDLGNQCNHIQGMGAPLTTHNFQSKSNRNLWVVLLNRTKDAVYESPITFLNRLMDTRRKPSQMER